MNVSGCNMLNDINFAFVSTMGGIVGPHGDEIKNGDFLAVSIALCLLRSEGCDSFPMHLDLALTSNKK